MKTATLLQWLAAGAAMSVVLTIGHPASADEAIEAGSSGLGVALPRVLRTDPAFIGSRGAPAATGLPVNSEVSDAAQSRLTREGIILPRALRADSARLDLRRVHASAPLLTRDAARTRARKARDRRIGLAALAGAGIGGILGAGIGSSWCSNEGGGSCVLSLGFGTLGGLAGAGIGAALGALGGKSGASDPTPRRRTPRTIGRNRR